MKIVIVSDTHERHDELGDLSGDVLIHCGDGGYGFGTTDDSVERLDHWFGRQTFDLVLCVGGNHDFALEARVGEREPVLRNARYLQDEAVCHGGLTFYGTPWVPELADWAFFRPAHELRERWDRIPVATDVLITHSPPQGVLDRNSRGKACGCPQLRARVRTIRPRLHCFGHVHASSGTAELDGTTFVNASMVDSQYRIARRPYVIEL